MPHWSKLRRCSGWAAPACRDCNGVSAKDSNLPRVTLQWGGRRRAMMTVEEEKAFLSRGRNRPAMRAYWWSPRCGQRWQKNWAGRMVRPRQCWAPAPLRPAIGNGYERQFVYVYGAAGRSKTAWIGGVPRDEHRENGRVPRPGQPGAPDRSHRDGLWTEPVRTGPRTRSSGKISACWHCRPTRPS